MTGIYLTASALSTATVGANAIASSVASTFSGNIAWFILVATIGLIVGIILWLARQFVNLGR